MHLLIGIFSWIYLQDKMGDISSLSNLMMKRYPLYDFKIRTCEVYL